VKVGNAAVSAVAVVRSGVLPWWLAGPRAG